MALSIIANAIEEPDKIVISTTKYRFKPLNIFYSNFWVFFSFVFYKFETVYFTSTRNKSGFLCKDGLLLFLARLRNKRVINHLHGADFKFFYRNSGILKSVIKYCYDKVESSIVLTNEMHSELEDFPKTKIECVANCYSQEFDTYPEHRIKSGFRILFLSNLMRSKGIIEFLDACVILLSACPEAQVVIAGMPYKDDNCSNKEIASLFFQRFNSFKQTYPGRVKYFGFVKGKMKLDILFESDIFVLPTWYPTEAFPLTIIEAMRAGNAIITTRHNFLPSIVKPENGIIVEPKKTEDLAIAMIDLLRDRKRLMEIQAYNRTYAQENYNQSIYINKVLGIIFKNTTTC